jgi:ATP-binding cassette subfamily B protein
LNIPIRQYLAILNTYLKAQKGRVALLALLLFVSIGLQLLSPQAIRAFIDTVQTGGTQQALVAAALIFLAVVIVQRLVNVFVTYASQQVAWIATNGLRSDLTLHVLTLDMSFHNSHTPGELLQRIDGDVDRLANFFSQFLLQIISGTLLTIGVLVLLFMEDWRIAALLAVFVIAYLVVHIWDQQWAAPEWRKEREYSTDLSGFVEERVAGVSDIQTSGAVAYTLHGFVELLRRRQWQALRADVVTDLGWALSKTFYALGTVAGMAMGAYLYVSGSITLGTVYLIIYYLGILNWPLDRIARQLEDLQRARISIERVSALLNTQSLITDRGEINLPEREPLAVDFEHVSFGYQSETPVLRDVSFSLKPGQVLGLLGRTGSGKTTLSRLLFRLYDVDAGLVKLDAVDVRQAPIGDLRERVGMVTQDVQIFQASVRDNLTFFDPSIPDNAILDAIDRLGLTPWFDTLPEGLDSDLAVEGAGLSAGEGQLLALARVFLKEPGLVILDEASSRLDPATENLLEQALDGLLADRTSIIIAHRLSTVERADAILILEQGEVREAGAYDDLISDPNSVFSGLLRTGLQEVLA